MPISIEKSNFMVMNFYNDPLDLSQYFIDTESRPIKNTNKIKYLGTIIEHNLSWQCHIEKIISNCKIGLNMLSSITSIKWGIHPKTALQFYKSIIRPKIEWASFLFCNSESKLLKKLDIIQNAAIRSCIGVIRTTPINVLHSMAGIPTLESRRNLTAKKIVAKAVSLKNNMLIPKFKLIKEKFINSQWAEKSLKRKTSCLFFQWYKNSDKFAQIKCQEKLNTFLIPFHAHFMEEDYIDSEFGKIFGKNDNKVSNNLKFQSERDKIFPHQNYIFTDGSKQEDNLCAYGI